MNNQCAKSANGQHLWDEESYCVNCGADGNELEPPHKHREAFCLMKYRCDNCYKIETLWNSRDGVTPFMIPCSDHACKGTMQHINWNEDKYAPDFKPYPIYPSMRVFVDLTEQKAKIYSAQFVDKYWDAPPDKYGSQMKDAYPGMTREQVISTRARYAMEDGGGGAPDIVTGKEYHESRK